MMLILWRIRKSSTTKHMQYLRMSNQNDLLHTLFLQLTLYPGVNISRVVGDQPEVALCYELQHVKYDTERSIVEADNPATEQTRQHIAVAPEPPAITADTVHEEPGLAGERLGRSAGVVEVRR